jgi:hypothetical protein
MHPLFEKASFVTSCSKINPSSHSANNQSENSAIQQEKTEGITKPPLPPLPPVQINKTRGRLLSNPDAADAIDVHVKTLH